MRSYSRLGILVIVNILVVSVLQFGIVSRSWATEFTLLLDFNTGALNAPGADLTFNGVGGFSVTFTDDKSGSANGVHITNENEGNIKVGNPTDFVLGTPDGLHSSGIVANFSQGVTGVRFFDTDDDATGKTLFAFDQFGTLIGQDGNGPFTVEPNIQPGDAQRIFAIDTSGTGGQLIWSIEFDTQVGVAGGANDGTYFTIDNFETTYSIAAPVPLSILIFGLVASGFIRRQGAAWLSPFSLACASNVRVIYVGEGGLESRP